MSLPIAQDPPPRNGAGRPESSSPERPNKINPTANVTHSPDVARVASSQTGKMICGCE
jgi:hypothetical protein